MNTVGETEHAKIPVTVLTGFLGSGKTTILHHLVHGNALRRMAVIINEFGEIGLDHDLIESTDENLTLLSNGCVCCSVRGDLIETLSDLARRQDQGGIGILDRVVIETTGLADPAPIAHTLMTHEDLMQRYELDQIVTTVDAVNGSGTLDRFNEAVKQAAVADIVVLTKTDIADEAAVAALRVRLKAINPGARLLDVVGGQIDPALLFRYLPGGGHKSQNDLRRWLGADDVAEAEQYAHSSCDDSCTAHDHAHHHHHDDGISSFCITRDATLPYVRFQSWLELVTSLRGDDLLRVKGLVGVSEHPDRPIVVHGVQHVFHPPVVLDRWPSDDRRTRIVFITRNIEKATIEDTLRVFERRAKRLT